MAGPGEPLWTAEDRDKALAYEVTQAEAHPNCGTRREDWVDADGKPHDPPLYEPIVQRCEGCAERERLRIHLEQEAADTFSVSRRTPEEQAAEHASARMRQAMAGVYVTLAPFDPYRDVERGGDD